MTRHEAERINAQEHALLALGFTTIEAEQLRRISMQLRRWHELECGVDNGCIEYDNDDDNGPAYWLNANTGKRYKMANRGAGARRRLAAIIAAHNDRPDVAEVRAYIQTDPRGAALYILRPGDVPDGGSADGYYTRGIVVY